MWVIYALLAAFSSALLAILAKLGFNEEKVDVTLATMLRVLIMLVFLLVVVFAEGKLKGFDVKNFTGKEWMYLVLSSIVAALSMLFYFTALQSGKTVAVVAIDRLSIVIASILGVFILHENLNFYEIVGIILMVAGALLLGFK